MSTDATLIRRFAGLPDSETDPALDACAAAAEAWYASAGVPATLAGDPLYDFWVANLAAWMYDNRGDSGSGTRIPDYIITSVHQLRYRAEAAEAAEAAEESEDDDDDSSDTDGSSDSSEDSTDGGDTE